MSFARSQCYYEFTSLAFFWRSGASQRFGDKDSASSQCVRLTLLVADSDAHFTMQSLFPSASALSATFGHATPYGLKKQHSAPSSRPARSELYSAWSVTEDAKQKATQLSDAAAKEFEKASSIAQAKTGKMELYSPQFYAAW